jgi:hypothetical protein
MSQKTLSCIAIYFKVRINNYAKQNINDRKPLSVYINVYLLNQFKVMNYHKEISLP